MAKSFFPGREKDITFEGSVNEREVEAIRQRDRFFVNFTSPANPGRLVRFPAAFDCVGQGIGFSCPFEGLTGVSAERNDLPAGCESLEFLVASSSHDENSVFGRIEEIFPVLLDRPR